MSFIKHLQSSLILGTKMTHPEDEHFEKQYCKELLSCIDQNKISEIENLIETGLDPDKCECKNISPLSYAIKLQKYESVQTLVEYGSDLYNSDCFGKKPLDYAKDSGNKNIIDLLTDTISYRALEENEDGFYAKNISEATSMGDFRALLYYHYKGESLFTSTSNRSTLLHLCIEGNNPKILIYLLNKGVNIDGADINKTSALILSAMEESHLELLKILIKRNATLEQCNSRHISTLTMAIKRHNIKAAYILIENGADVNIRDGIETPLTLTHKALTNAYNPLFKKELRDLETLLFTKSAHVNSNDRQLMWSPLMLASSHYQDRSNIEHIKLLICLGANIDQFDKNHRTALMISSSLGRIEAIEILLKNNANINLYDKFGWTALMLAVYYNQIETIKYLLYNGADVNFQNKKGLNAMKIAVDNDRAVIIPILKEFGAVLPND